MIAHAHMLADTHMRRECRFILGSSMTSSETFSSTLRPSTPLHTPRCLFDLFMYVHDHKCVCKYACMYVIMYVLQFLTVLRLFHICLMYLQLTLLCEILHG